MIIAIIGAPGRQERRQAAPTNSNSNSTNISISNSNDNISISNMILVIVILLMLIRRQAALRLDRLAVVPDHGEQYEHVCI